MEGNTAAATAAGNVSSLGVGSTTGGAAVIPGGVVVANSQTLLGGAHQQASVTNGSASVLNNRVSLRQEILIAAQRKFGASNLYRGEVDGRFGAQTRASIKASQRSRQMRVIELPDPDTVVALLLRD